MTPVSPTRTFMTIGDVLKSLRDEFPDVSISKIRFLESEGLIEPERTASGYRKFSRRDVDRLRYILRLQRDRFMPLKVIRQRLEHVDPEGPVQAGGDGAAVTEEEEEPAGGGLHLSFTELVSSGGLEAEQVRELEEYGLIDAHPLDGGVYYDEDDLIVLKIARDFGKYGIEPRHLRMYRHFAERESGLFEQILLPLARMGGTNGRRQLVQSLTELAKLSRRLKHLLLNATLREQLRG
ncbi:MAG: transcriptional regulator FtsR [Actinomycetota bacterium]